MGVPVLGITSQPGSPIARTNTCKTVECRNVNGQPLIETLVDLGKTFEEKAVLFPSADPQVLLISENREQLAPYYHFGLPSKDVVKLLLDKTAFAPFAEKSGFLTPSTLLVDRMTDINRSTEGLKYPCILKPFCRTQQWKQDNREKKVLFIEDEDSLLRLLPKAFLWADRLVLQEWIAGADSEIYFCLMYFDADAEPRATFVGRKIRQWPPEAGSTASAEKKFNSTVLEESLRLFKAVGYQGLGSVEYKFDSQDQKFKIMEPTVGRPNLQSYLAVANGINIPYVAYCDLIGRPVTQLDHPALPGPVKWINEWSELRSARFYLQRGDLTLKEWYTSVRGTHSYSLFSVSDPLPFVLTIGRTMAENIPLRSGSLNEPEFSRS